MARKLNKALVAAVASVAVVAGGTYLAKDKIVGYMRPVSKLVATADAYAQSGDWANATLYYGKAASRAGTDIDLQLKYADAMDHTVKGDIQTLQKVRQTQASILANDPRSIPALRQVLSYQKADVQQSPGNTAAVRTLTGTAERLEKLVPGDREARIGEVTAVFEPFVRNLEVKQEDVDAQRDAADKLFDEKPDDAEPLRMAVVFRTFAANKSLQQGDVADAKDRITKALEFVDAAIAKAPNLAGAWFVRSDVYRLAAYVLPDKDDKKRDEFVKEYTKSLQKADELVQPSDPMLLPIRTAALKQLEFTNPKQAEARYRKLLEEMPNDRQPRLMLAEFLNRQPARRDDAVAVLETPFKPTAVLRGMESVNQRFIGLIEQIRKTSIRLGALQGISDPAERKKRLDVIDQEYRAISSDPDISTRFKGALLRIQGGMELAQNKISDAINTLDSALKLMDPGSTSSIEQDMRNDTLMEYAQAQLRLNQSGEARPALADLVQHKPENFAARALLADILMRERSFDGADQQIAVLERVAGDNPAVQKMRLQLDAYEGKLKDKYPSMPETTRDTQFLKLQAAATLNDAAEVLRLAKLILASNPADIDGVNAFVQASLAAGKREDAVTAVAAAIKAKPGDARFSALAASLAAVKPEDRERLINERIENLSDPYVKSLAVAEQARAQGRPDDALKAYKDAQKQKPDDPRAFEAQFQTSVTAGRYAEADAILPDLARLNTDQAGGAIRRVQLTAAKAATEPDPARRQTMFKEVAAQAQTVAQQNSELASTSLLYAQVLAQSGEYSGAVDQFQATIDKSPTNLDAIIGIADCLMRTDRRGEAASRIESAKAIAPDDGRVKELQLNYEMKFGDPLKAIDTLAARAKQDPDSVQAVARLGLALEQVATSRTGDEAKQYLARAGDVYAKAFEHFPQDLRFLSAYADIERRLDQPQVAEAAIEKVANDPGYKDRADIQLLLADQYYRSSKFDDAVRVLTAVVTSTKPAPVDAVQRLALIFARANRLPDALAALDLRKDDASVQRMRVSLLLDANDVAGASQAIDTALASHPDADTNLLASFVALRSGNLDNCEAFANKALATRPNDPSAMMYRAQVKLNRTPPDLDGARDDMVKARDQSPRSSEVRLLLAEIYRRRGDRDAALGELQQAWTNDHTSKQVLLRLVDAYAHAAPPALTAIGNTFDDARQTPALANDPDVMFAEADNWANRNDSDKAVALAKSALAVDPKNAQLQQRYFDLLIQAKAYQPLISETTTLLQDNPNNPSLWWVYRDRGIAFRRLDQTADAQKALDASFNLAASSTNSAIIEAAARSIAEAFGPKVAMAKLEPYADPALQVLSAEFAHDAGDIAGSIAKLEPLLTDRSKLSPPVLRRALQALGLNYLQSMPPSGAKARPVFDELLKQTPDDIPLLNNQSCVLLLPDSGGTTAEALKLAQHAYDLMSGSDNAALWAIIQDTYGWALIKNNRANDGMEQLRKSAETATFPDVFLHIAEQSLATGNLADAESALNDAKSRIDDATKAKQPVDPTMTQKLAELSDQLAKKKPADGG